MSLNGNKSVKISQKMKEKLKGFMSKVKGGLKTVPYVPGSIFEVFKDVPKAVATLSTAKKEDEEKQKSLDTKDNARPDNVKTDEKGSTVVEPNPEAEPVQTELVTSLPVIKGKKVDVQSILKKQAKAEKEDEKNTKNNPVKPEKVSVKTKDTEKKEPETPKKHKKDLKDLTAFDTYREYKYAYFWNYYFNKYDAETLEKVAKDFAKGADTDKYRDVFTEAQFNSKKDDQLKAKEIAELNKAHAEEMEAAEEKRKADIQATSDARQAEVDDLTEKLSTARSKNRVVNAKLKAVNEAIEQIKEVIAPLQIGKIDEIISSAMDKCDGIDKRAEEREKAKESEPKAEPVQEDNVEQKPIDEQVEEIMKDINKKVYGDTSEEEKTPVSVEPQEDTKDVYSSLANVASQASEQKAIEEAPKADTQEGNSIFDDLDSMFPQKAEDSKQDNSIVLNSNNEDYPGVVKVNEQGEVTTNWEKSPITSENSFDNKNAYDKAQYNSEIGQRGFEIFKNSNGAISFDDAKEQAKEEYEADGKHIRR